jgi:hypothetical protein
LFYFPLSNTVNSSEVKRIKSGNDPNLAAAGLKGGDFSNSINDALAEEVYLRNYKEVKKSTFKNR